MWTHFSSLVIIIMKWNDVCFAWAWNVTVNLFCIYLFTFIIFSFCSYISKLIIQANSSGTSESHATNLQNLLEDLKDEQGNINFSIQSMSIKALGNYFCYKALHAKLTINHKLTINLVFTVQFPSLFHRLAQQSYPSMPETNMTTYYV